MRQVPSLTSGCVQVLIQAFSLSDRPGQFLRQNSLLLRCLLLALTGRCLQLSTRLSRSTVQRQFLYSSPTSTSCVALLSTPIFSPLGHPTFQIEFLETTTARASTEGQTFHIGESTTNLNTPLSPLLVFQQTTRSAGKAALSKETQS